MQKITLYISKLLPLFLLFRVGTSYPKPQAARVPEINVSHPSEVNSLQSENQVGPAKSRTIQDTIKEVETLIKNDPTLPRLTRGEIVDILDNITKTDLEKQQKSLKTGSRNQKAVMLVMPYTPNQNNGEADIQHLYTKPPITRIVGDAEKSTTNAPVRRRRPTTLPRDDLQETIKQETQVYKIPSRTRNVQRSTEPPLTLDVLNEKIPDMTESTPSKPVQRRRKPQVVTRQPQTISSRPQSSFDNVEKQTQTSSTKYSNHKYPEDSKAIASVSSKDGIKVIGAPDLSSKRLKPNSTPTENDDNNVTPPKQLSDELSAIGLKPVMIPTTYRPILADINLPDGLKFPIRDFDLVNDAKQNTIKYSSQYDSSSARFPLPSFNKERVNEILNSVSAIPATTTLLPDISKVADSLSPDMKELLASFGLLSEEKPKKVIQETYLSPEPVSISGDSYVQFKPLPDDVGAGDEMDVFLSQFGLGRSARSSTKSSKKSKSVLKKQEVLSEIPDFEPEMLPSEMKEVLTDIGLTDRQGRRIQSASLVKEVEKPSVANQVRVIEKPSSVSKTTPSKQHVFNPSNSNYASDEELNKLSQLLDTIKQLEKLNRTVTEDDLNPTQIQNIKYLVDSLKANSIVPLNEQEAGPNPLVFDLGHKATDAKRQKNQAEAPTTTEKENIVETSTLGKTESTSATEQTNTPNIKDLEDSFGGSSNTATEAVAVLPQPTSTPRTGFYYLLDWNSFLDIDDQNGKRVNLRFQPKVGDPKRFYSVTVP